MTKLDEYRIEIDEIDRELVQLFEKRMETVLKVANYKKENGMEVLQSSREEVVLQKAVDNLNDKKCREEVVLQKAVDNLNDKKYENDIREVFELLMRLSRESQKKELGL